MRSSFQIKWWKDFQENITNSINTVQNERYNFF